ncbi:3621_t:CDS:2 [Funneliformis geosporum]|uniref:3621_t:CDS:1 n=1 Tax=Funneliformis geosporum TaxID=1117311 RepID=A0A9W4WLW7_9GLOM|nr:3621_t:CDS:2 [Funneliformis geosporum]
MIDNLTIISITRERDPFKVRSMQYSTGSFEQEQNKAFSQFSYQNFAAPNYSYNDYNQFLRGTSTVDYIDIKKESANLQSIDLTQEKEKFDFSKEELEKVTKISNKKKVAIK